MRKPQNATEITVESEKHLINRANNMIGVCGVRFQHAINSSPLKFRETIENQGHGITLELFQMGGRTLGEIISLAILPGHETEWRRTPANECTNGTDSVGLLECAAFRPGHTGSTFLAINARMVMYAAMYDILATENTLRIEAGEIARSVFYVPPPLLARFVRKVRLKHLAQA